MDLDKRIGDKLDYLLIFMIFILFCISCVSLYEAQANHLVSGNYLLQQIIWYILALPMLSIALFVDLDIIKRVSLYIYLFCILLLLGILVAPDSISPTINGAKGWYRVGPFSIQPTEFMKIGFILALGSVISKSNDSDKPRVQTLKAELILVFKMFLYLLPLVYFTKKFPDMGSLMVYLFIFLSILLVSSIRLRTILLVLSPFILVITGLVAIYIINPDFFFKDLIGSLPNYQAERFYGWLDAQHYTNSMGYQLQNALLTIGSGQLYGHDITNSVVPYAYSDFIFAIIGGAYGFLGSAILIVIFFIMIYRIVMIIMGYHDSYGQVIGAGIIGMIGFQLFQNIGMTVGLLPITGLSLPFISYGGSSLIINMIAIGLILNVNIHTKKFMFS